MTQLPNFGRTRSNNTGGGEAALQAVERDEQRYRSFVELTSQVVWICDVRGEVHEDIPMWRAFTGQSLEQTRGWGWLDAIHPDDRERTAAIWSQAVRTGTTYEIEYRIRRHDGDYRWCSGRGVPICERGGRIREWIGACHDITERKRAEEQMRALLDIAQSVSGTLNADALLADVQRQAAAALQCTTVVTFQRDAISGQSRIVAQYGIPEQLAGQVFSLEFAHHSDAAQRLLRGEPVLFNDLSGLPLPVRQLAEHFHVGAVVAAPLRVRGHHYGTLAAVRPLGSPPFTPNEVELCVGIARQLGIGMEASELYRAQQVEAQVSGALARMGQELILSLETPRLLDRLCALTVEALQCDVSATLLPERSGDTHVIAAGHGFSAEQRDSMRLLRIPHAAIAGLLSGLDRDGVMQIDLTQPPTPWARLPAQYGISRLLYVPLRRGDEIIGLLAAGFVGAHPQPFSRTGERIACGIAHLASLALEDARLFEDLQRANRLKSEFVATMSHELRTPMNIIMGYTDLLLDHTVGPLTGEQMEMLTAIDRSARQLLDLINATLDLSRLEAGRLPVEFVRVDLASLLAELQEDARAFQRDGVKLTWSIRSNLPSLVTDAIKFKIVVKNLIQNAIKFTPCGTVCVQVAAADGGIELRVTDTGIGIPPEALETIFDPFRQLDSSLKRSAGGVGLGLHLVRRILELLGGRIRVESAVGQGSTFAVWLPQRPRQSAESAAEPAASAAHTGAAADAPIKAAPAAWAPGQLSPTSPDRAR